MIFLSGIKVHNSAHAVNNLLFADDTLLFGEASMEVASQFSNIIHLHESVSEQLVNLSKSEVVFSRLKDQTTQIEIARILGAPIVAAHDKYLGLPAVHARSRKKLFSFIKDKVLSRLACWQDRLDRLLSKLSWQGDSFERSYSFHSNICNGLFHATRQFNEGNSAAYG